MTFTKASCLAAFLLPVGLAGCMEADEAASGSATATPSPAEQACLAAVSRETNNGDVTLLASETAESGTFITIGVGEDRAPWQCAVDGDGNVWNVEYMGMNG